MKKSAVISIIMAGLAAGGAFAQMAGVGMGGNGGHMGDQQHQTGNMMSSEQSHQMMDSQMMNHEMMRDISGMMGQMSEIIHKMTATMDHGSGSNHDAMKEIGNMMRDLAAQMSEMSTHIERGKMDQATVKAMRGKMELLIKKLDAMQKDGK